MDTNEDSIVILNSVKGIENVRPPTLDFLKLKDTDDYTEYKIITKKNSKKKEVPKKRMSRKSIYKLLGFVYFL